MNLQTEQHCNNIDNSSKIFFAEDQAGVDTAKAICNSCPSKVSCLNEALDRQEFAGVWGGQLFRKGVIVERIRGRGRPTLVEKAEDKAAMERVKELIS